MWILGHEILHFLIATLIAIFVFWKFRNWYLIVLVYLVSLFLDLDHLFDYFIFSGFQFSFGQFLNASYFCPSGHLFIPFHAWEWIVVLAFLPRSEALRPWTWSITLAVFGHLLLDQATNSMHWAGYSLIFRALNGFDINQVSFGCGGG